jgi:hypothetical protein
MVIGEIDYSPTCRDHFIQLLFKLRQALKATLL